MNIRGGIRMTLALALLMALPLFLTGCEGMESILQGLSKIFEGAKMVVDGIGKALKGDSKGEKPEGSSPPQGSEPAESSPDSGKRKSTTSAGDDIFNINPDQVNPEAIGIPKKQ